ncbi:MAG: gliding motility protein GldM [Taibaiella sp.]|nr:gliding motility protein GldM [Taibaiella sp.]
MAGVNETPRQKMMGILYLVLLGLAATTITEKVLDSFRNITVGLENSTHNVQGSIDQTFASFEKSTLKDDPVRAKPYWERANRVKAAAADLSKSINDVRAKFEAECGPFDTTLGDYKMREDVDLSYRIMITKKGGEELKKKIEEAKAKILAELDPKDRGNFRMALNADAPSKTKGGVKASWEDNFFGEGIPLTAAFTALTKINADLVSTENAAVKKILGDVTKTDLVLDQYAAIAVPTSPTYLLLGQPYVAEVFLTAFSNSINPDVVVGGQKLSVKDGKGIYNVGTSREGDFKWSATLTMKKADGTNGTWKTPEMTYTVAKPSAVVSPDFMNVFYIGVPNPVSISAPGTPVDKLKPSIDNGSIIGSKGKYEVMVTKAGPCKVSIFGVDGAGKTVKLGESDFRCKRLPNPKAKFGGKSGGTVPKGLMTSNDKIFASLDDFEFKAQFTVDHAKIYIVKPRQEAMVFDISGTNLLNASIKSALSSCPPGTRVFFDDIFAMGPDKVRRSLDPITYTIQ